MSNGKLQNRFRFNSLDVSPSQRPIQILPASGKTTPARGIHPGFRYFNGEVIHFTAGDALFPPGEGNKHKARVVGERVKLFLVENA